MAISTFQRREVKFLLSAEQFAALLTVVNDHMNPDSYCLDCKEYGIYNIYYDTPENLLVRRSIEKPYYKEKLRLRSYYSPAAPDSSVFLEVKKKIGGIVTKRRVSMTLQEADAYVQTRVKPYYERFIDRQVMREMDIFLNFYGTLQPRQYISYQRAAYFGKDDPEFRLTFDRQITARRYDLTLAKESYGEQIILPDQRIMEIKVPGSIPLWMSKALSELEIRRISFSKYGTAYKNYVRRLAEEQKEERKIIYA
jgi:hypothetical protein